MKWTKYIVVTSPEKLIGVADWGNAISLPAGNALVEVRVDAEGLAALEQHPEVLHILPGLEADLAAMPANLLTEMESKIRAHGRTPPNRAAGKVLNVLRALRDAHGIPVAAMRID